MSILRREVYFDNTGDIVRFWDWAITGTTLGAMAEPFLPGERHSLDVDFPTFDPTDEIARIDSMQAGDVDRQYLMLGDGCHGGYQLPRVGR